MKNYLLYFFIIIIWIALIPFSPSVFNLEEYNKSPGKYEEKIKVLNSDGKISDMTIDEYVLGVMLTEMPASYDKQALLAQAVAIRSYTLYMLEIAEKDNRKHPDADLCTDEKCCQDYITYEELCSKTNKKSADQRFAAISAAVYETSGEIIIYDGKPAMALYHISSPARTESYKNIFGSDVPYLTAVDNVDESGFVFYKKEVHLTFEELQSLLVSNGYDYAYTKDEKAFAAPNENLRSEYAVFGSTEIPAEIFAELTNLNSLCFEITKADDGYNICSLGYGSGLGMSQYGANILASKGYSYKDILSFYYKDTVIEKRK